jgi:glycosyltransferase involved in cell wall biosynthesis
MKVLHLNTHDFGGAANAAIRLHKGLLRLGIQSEFMSLYKTRHDIPAHITPSPDAVINVEYGRPTLKNILLGRYKHYWRKATNASDTNILIKQLARQTNAEYASYYKTPYRLHHTKEVIDADIIHLHWVADFIDYETFFAHIIKPIIWTLHDENPFRGIFHYKNDELTNANDVLKQLDKLDAYPGKRRAVEHIRKLKVVGPSNWITHAAQSSDFFKRGLFDTVPYGIDTEVFKPYSRQMAREIFQLGANDRVLLFVSENLHNYRKGFDLLVEALRQEVGIPVSLCVVGKSPQGDLPVKVKYLGSISDERLMALAYAAADVLLLPSREDNLPNTMLEAICCGTPVITFPVGGVPEVIIDGFNGFLTASVSAPDLLAAIIRFFNSANNFKQDVIRNDAVNKFALNLQASRYKNIYEQMLLQ